MTTTIITKNSSTASAVPTSSDLVQGELAVNVTDKRLFTENASATIVELGTNPSSITTADITATGTVTANSNLSSSNAVLTGGTVNGIVIGGTTPSAITGTNITANTGFSGPLTGNVTGNLTGNVTGNVTGNLTGNVTASSGTTTLNNLVLNGTVDFNTAVLTDLGAPVASTDAATKGYVDTQVSNLVAAAPAALDTLNELAAAIGDDANFSTTITNSIATKLPLAGGTMTGAIAMGTNKITGLGTPTAGTDAANKTYADTKLSLSGGTMTGNIVLGSNSATSTATPTTDDELTRKGYVDSILGSATSAATSAAAAATSASNAATSESNASTSASNAATSETNAAASYDAFDDRYLGSKTSDPTLDNDGDALITGALYFNTTSNVMKVYNGSVWQTAAITTNNPTFTGTVTADGLSLGDNEKATFGAGNDLEIYHDGSQSIIADVGTGPLVIKGGNNGTISLQNGNGETMLSATGNGSVDLYYDNAIKLSTTSTGIDVTGTVVSDAIQVDTDSGIVLKDGADSRTLTFKIDAGTGRYQASGSADHYFTTTDSNLSRFYIANNGDISFYEDTGTTAKFFWDASAESLGIGTSSPAATLDVAGTTIGSGDVGFGVTSLETTSATRTALTLDNSFFAWGRDSYNEAGVAQGSYRNSAGNDEYRTTGVAASQVAFSAGTINLQVAASGTNGNTISWTDGLVVDNSGNVGIGTDSPTETLSVRGTGSQYILVQSDDNSGSGIYFGNTGSNDRRITLDSSSLLFENFNGSAEYMRIDSSGNLLVGTTDADNQNNSAGSSADNGFAVNSVGHFNAARYNGIVQYLNRTGTDGDIVQFRKDGTTVGSIGNDGTSAYFNSTADGGLARAGTVYFKWSSAQFYPNVDDSYDLGILTKRFDDVYATNGTIQTSDRNEKQDIEALSEAEQRVAVACKGLLRKFRWKSAVEEKGDDARIHFGIIAQDLQAAFEAEGLDAGRYAMFIHSTWTDEETGEERSRMGVRYSELLAFIIAAI